MKNTFGGSVSVTLFGESHGEQIGAVLDGIAPGILVDPTEIAHRLALRRPHGAISTARVEEDAFSIVSGVFEGRTTGTPICILIPNTDAQGRDYQRNHPRPGHADYAAGCKYHGFEDYRGGGHFSGRLTAALVAVGAIAQAALAQKGIRIGTHIATLGGVADLPMEGNQEELALLDQRLFPVLDPAAETKMKAVIEQAAREGDSVGGVLETVVLGVPSGVGEPWFDSVEGMLSHALFSIPAVKGVEFGSGFSMAEMRGSQANDAFCIKNGTVATKTNHNGGINGGITNGMPIRFRCAVKPTPSIFLPQTTVTSEMKEETLRFQGRHDPAIVHRARAVVDAMSALCLCDLLALRFGTDYFCPMQENASKGAEK